MKIIYLAWASIFLVLAVLSNGAKADAVCKRPGEICDPKEELNKCCIGKCQAIGGNPGKCI
uniref:Venom toxin-like peptide n=1 Tax=Aphidius ervi TaxID=37627 RepID=A0A034WXR3_APHER